MKIYRSTLERAGYFFSKLKTAKDEIEGITHLSAARIDRVQVQRGGKWVCGAEAYELKKERAQEKYSKYAALYLKALEEKQEAIEHIKDETLKSIIRLRFDCGATWGDVAFIVGKNATATKNYYYEAFTNDGVLKDSFLKE